MTYFTQEGHEESKKMWKTEMEPLQGDRAWSRGPKVAQFEILRYEITITNFENLIFKNEVSNILDF